MSADQNQALVDELGRIGRMINSMIQKADLFCGQPHRELREAAGHYFASGTNDLMTDDLMADDQTESGTDDRSPITR